MLYTHTFLAGLWFASTYAYAAWNQKNPIPERQLQKYPLLSFQYTSKAYFSNTTILFHYLKALSILRFRSMQVCIS
jgi:hypothetical protein